MNAETRTTIEVLRQRTIPDALRWHSTARTLGVTHPRGEAVAALSALMATEAMDMLPAVEWRTVAAALLSEVTPASRYACN